MKALIEMEDTAIRWCQRNDDFTRMFNFWIENNRFQRCTGNHGRRSNVVGKLYKQVLFLKSVGQVCLLYL